MQISWKEEARGCNQCGLIPTGCSLTLHSLLFGVPIPIDSRYSKYDS